MNLFGLFVVPGIVMIIIASVICILLELFGDPVDERINPVPHCKHYSIEREFKDEIIKPDYEWTIYRCRNCDSILAFGDGKYEGYVIELPTDPSSWRVILDDIDRI